MNPLITATEALRQDDFVPRLIPWNANRALTSPVSPTLRWARIVVDPGFAVDRVHDGTPDPPLSLDPPQ
jgi:hypothetical protein